VLVCEGVDLENKEFEEGETVGAEKKRNPLLLEMERNTKLVKCSAEG
jgi:hypothetical protein